MPDSPRRLMPRRLALGAAVVAVLAAGCSAGDDAGSVVEARDPLRSGPQGNVAQFVVRCQLSHFAYDDPIVLPDMPGESHLHQFFGNVDIDSNPDYDRVANSDTSCRRSSDTASYWAPALLAATGDVIAPQSFTAYYRPGPGVEPAVIEPYPASLMMVAGDAGADDEQPLDIVAWSCGSGLARHTRPPDCRDQFTDRATSTTSLRLWITFPDCWDGDRLTSLGSNAHVRYSEDGACPDPFPVAIPQLQMAIDFPAVDPAGLALASGGTETAHADFWNVWDQQELEDEVRLCLNRDLVCGTAN